MNKIVKEFVELIKNNNCDYGRCKELITEIGGYTNIIEVEYRCITTPLHELISYGHYDFALEAINSANIDPNVRTEDEAPIIWDLQYLDGESDSEKWDESEKKLRIMRALISKGADPNPFVDNEELISFIRCKIAECSETYPNHVHLLYMEHIIDAFANGKKDSFFKLLEDQPIKYVMVSKTGFLLVDNDVCDAEYLIFIFENGERYCLSGYQTGDDEWDFYAAPVKKEIILSEKCYNLIYPTEDYIRFKVYEINEFGYFRFRFVIDDASLLVYNDENGVTVVIRNLDPEADDVNRKRKDLFIDREV